MQNYMMIHMMLRVEDAQRSVKFYEDAFGFHVTRKKEKPDKKFDLIYLSDDDENFELELTWLRDMDKPYNLGDCEFHLAFRTDDYEAAHAKHKAMGCICYENPKMGIYFITDPDGYWLEVLPPVK